MTIKITNSEKYQNVIEVNFNGRNYNNSFHGNIAIELSSGEVKEYDGEHGQFDFEDLYGFQIIPQLYMIIDNTSEKQYIDEDGENCSLEENAGRYESFEEALEFAKTLKGYGEWYSITEITEIY
jgi:hypothetical protein